MGTVTDRTSTIATASIPAASPGDDSPIEVDVIVVGLGPAGEAAGGQLAEAGLRVVGIERGLVGGECPYWGCVPSKMMIRAANVLAESRRVGELAGSSTTTPDWAPVARRIREQATDNWDDTVAVDRFVGKGGIFVRGDAEIVADRTVTANGTTYVATKGIIVATGTAAAVPPIPGLADTPFWTNHEIIETETLPRRLIVLGGGAIGSELAQVMARFGVEVTVIGPSVVGAVPCSRRSCSLLSETMNTVPITSSKPQSMIMRLRSYALNSPCSGADSGPMLSFI